MNKRMTSVIGVTGYAQTGKDSIGDILVQDYGYVRTAFAAYLKEMARQIFGWDGRKDDDGRRGLQLLGEAARCFDEGYWIKVVGRALGFDKNASPPRLVITDVRFRNEAEWIRSVGGVVWRVRRAGVGPVNDHVSETECDRITPDTSIDNNGTLEDLRVQVARVFTVYAQEADGQ